MQGNPLEVCVVLPNYVRGVGFGWGQASERERERSVVEERVGEEEREKRKAGRRVLVEKKVLQGEGCVCERNGGERGFHGGL